MSIRDFGILIVLILMASASTPRVESRDRRVRSDEDRYCGAIVDLKTHIDIGSEFGSLRLGPFAMLEATSGEIVNAAEFNGSAVLVVFWWTQCLICQESLKRLDGIQNKFGKRGFRVLTAAIDTDREVVLRSLSASGEFRAWKSVYNSNGDVSRLMRSQSVSNIPAWYLFGKDGALKFRDGLIATDKKIEQLLTENIE